MKEIDKFTKYKVEVMQAYLDGKQIEVHLPYGSWTLDDNPSWNWGTFSYRVKPPIPVASLKPGDVIEYQGRRFELLGYICDDMVKVKEVKS